MITPGETNPLLRRVYFMIYIADGSALADDGSAATAPPAGTIQVSINGAAFVDGGGTLAHIGRGEYRYEATAGEVPATGFLGVKFVRTGYRTEMVTAIVGQPFATGETNATRLRWPFAIYGTSFEPPALATGATVVVPSDLQLSLNGQALVNASVAGGTLHEVGSGLYYYQGVAADAASPGVMSVQYSSSGFQPAVTTIDIVDPPAPAGDVPTLSDFDPANGVSLAADRNTAKFTPISFDINNPTASRFSIWLKFRNSLFGDLVYDSVVGFLPPFDNVASVYNGTRMTVLQQAGWQDTVDGIFVGGRADAAVVPVRPGGPGSIDPPNAP